MNNKSCSIDNTVFINNLSASGDVNIDDVVKLAKKYFGSIKPSKIEKRAWTEEPTQHAQRKIILYSKNTAIPVFERH